MIKSVKLGIAYVCTHCTNQHANPDHGDCRYTWERYATLAGAWVCECEHCLPEHAKNQIQLAALRTRSDKSAEGIRKRKCLECEKLIVNCTCGIERCSVCAKEFVENSYFESQCLAAAHLGLTTCGYCCQDAIDEQEGFHHGHYQCTHPNHIGFDGERSENHDLHKQISHRVVLGGWNICDDISDGICEQHEHCADCHEEDDDECEHEDIAWDYNSLRLEEDYVYIDGDCEYCDATFVSSNYFNPEEFAERND